MLLTVKLQTEKNADQTSIALTTDAFSKQLYVMSAWFISCSLLERLSLDVINWCTFYWDQYMYWRELKHVPPSPLCMNFKYTSWKYTPLWTGLQTLELFCFLRYYTVEDRESDVLLILFFNLPLFFEISFFYFCNPPQILLTSKL